MKCHKQGCEKKAVPGKKYCPVHLAGRKRKIVKVVTAIAGGLVAVGGFVLKILKKKYLPGA